MRKTAGPSSIPYKKMNLVYCKVGGCISFSTSYFWNLVPSFTNYNTISRKLLLDMCHLQRSISPALLCTFSPDRAYHFQDMFSSALTCFSPFLRTLIHDSSGEWNRELTNHRHLLVQQITTQGSSQSTLV